MSHLPDGWAEMPLADVVEILDSRRVPVNAKDRADREGAVPYYGATGQVGWIDEALFDDELVLLGEDGAPFLDASRPKAYRVNGPSWVNNHAHVLRAKSPLGSNRYLMHYLNTVDFLPYVTGTTRLKLPQGPMKRIPVPVPPLDEQHRIVAAIEEQLSRLDAGVASLERAKRNISRMRASVLTAAVSGVLVRSAKDGRGGTTPDTLRPGAETGPKSPPLAPPLGWSMAPLGDLVDGLRYGTSTKCAYDGPGAPVLRIPNVRDLGITTSDLKKAVDPDAPLASTTVVAGDLLVIRTNGSRDLIGRVGVVPASLSGFAFASYLIRARPTSAILPQFLALLLDSPPYRALLRERAATSAGQYNISASTLAQVPIVFPNGETQGRIVAEVDRQLSLLESMNHAAVLGLQRAEALRQSILREAFAGHLVSAERQDPRADNQDCGQQR